MRKDSAQVELIRLSLQHEIDTLRAEPGRNPATSSAPDYEKGGDCRCPTAHHAAHHRAAVVHPTSRRHPGEDDVSFDADGNGTACAIAKFWLLQTDDWRDWILENDKYCARSVASGTPVRDLPQIRRCLSQGKVRSQPVPDHEGAFGYQ